MGTDSGRLPENARNTASVSAHATAPSAVCIVDLLIVFLLRSLFSSSVALILSYLY